MHPMAAFINDFPFRVSEAGRDGADELLSHERIGASPDDQHGTVEGAPDGGVGYPAVPDVDVVGDHLGCDGRPDVDEPVELLFA